MRVKGRVINLWLVNKGKDGKRRVGDLSSDYLIPICVDKNFEQIAEIEMEGEIT